MKKLCLILLLLVPLLAGCSNSVQTMLDDFASSQKKCSCCEKEEVLVAAKIEKAQQNIGRFPKSDNPEYIRLKKLKWEHKIQLACNRYIKTLNQFQIENEGFVAFLKLFQNQYNLLHKLY